MRRRSGFGWLELVAGILLIALGIWAFMDPGLALAGMVFAYGVAAIIIGIADIVLYIQVERYTGLGPILSLISGVLSVMSGMMLVVYPRTGVLVLTVLFPIWFIAHCISRLAHLHMIRLTAGKAMYYFTLIVNIIGLVLGFMMLFRPLVSLLSASYIAGTYLILLGVDGIVVAFSGMGSRK